jgi:hypothetical protein
MYIINPKSSVIKVANAAPKRLYLGIRTRLRIMFINAPKPVPKVTIFCLFVAYNNVLEILLIHITKNAQTSIFNDKAEFEYLSP